MTRVIVAADEVTEGASAVVSWLAARGYAVEVRGPLAGDSAAWVDLGHWVGHTVAGGEADWGVAMCWTGTGISIAANKVSGVRAALCTDAETARGARRWNDANVLCLSLRLLTPALAQEILAGWTEDIAIDPADAVAISRVELSPG